MNWFQKLFGIVPKPDAFESYIEREKARQLQDAIEARMNLLISIESQQSLLDGCNKTIERLNKEKNDVKPEVHRVTVGTEGPQSDDPELIAGFLKSTV